MRIIESAIDITIECTIYVAIDIITMRRFVITIIRVIDITMIRRFDIAIGSTAICAIDVVIVRWVGGWGWWL